MAEDYGGWGHSFAELDIVLEEMGRVLLCAPFLCSAVLAAGAILHAGTAARKQPLLPDLASGKRRGALAVTPPMAQGTLAASVCWRIAMAQDTGCRASIRPGNWRD